jgi:hypothetical protein
LIGSIYVARYPTLKAYHLPSFSKPNTSPQISS